LTLHRLQPPRQGARPVRAAARAPPQLDGELHSHGSAGGGRVAAVGVADDDPVAAHRPAPPVVPHQPRPVPRPAGERGVVDGDRGDGGDVVVRHPHPGRFVVSHPRPPQAAHGGGGAGASAASNEDGGLGGSGRVAIRFLTADIVVIDQTNATETTSGSYTILTWTTSGNFEFENAVQPIATSTASSIIIINKIMNGTTSCEQTGASTTVCTMEGYDYTTLLGFGFLIAIFGFMALMYVMKK